MAPMSVFLFCFCVCHKFGLKIMFDKKVLSVQSFVTRGYVGNKAASYPFLLYGFQMDSINSVSLAGLPFLPEIRGTKLSLEEYNDIIHGLRHNHFLDEYRFFMCGFLNNPELIKAVSETAKEIAKIRSEQSPPKPFTFLCDPVFGDDGTFYCRQEVMEAYRSIVSCADIMTPNGFEASSISGINIVDVPSAIKAADWFHERGLKSLVITSFWIEDNRTKMYCLLSTVETDNQPPKRYLGHVPAVPRPLGGAGDVFAASLLVFMYDHSLVEACRKALGLLLELAERSFSESGEGETKMGICLPQSVDIFLSPKYCPDMTRVESNDYS